MERERTYSVGNGSEDKIQSGTSFQFQTRNKNNQQLPARGLRGKSNKISYVWMCHF
jgi:hypothetical protein